MYGPLVKKKIGVPLCFKILFKTILNDPFNNTLNLVVNWTFHIHKLL